jgi:hypothetical protein
MEDLRIPPTKNTPEIILNSDGIVKIRGRSIHENAADFYIPVDEWITGYINNPADVTTVDISIEYINSASIKIFVSLLQKITYVTLKHKKFVINWYYEEGDEDIFERGEFLASILHIRMNFVKVR